jgi:DnaJ-domain-containing protein 1
VEKLLLPGSKGWIKKYFDLVEKKQIQVNYVKPEGLEKGAFLHAALGRTGIAFGFPSHLLFAEEINDKKWTSDEKLKVLLFEAHLFVYLSYHEGKDFDQHALIDSLVTFYGKHNSSKISKLFGFFMKETPNEKLESILTQRVDIKMNLLENKFWVNYLSNVFIYLDVILYNDFIQHKKRSAFYNYDDLAMNALTAITLSAYSDGAIEEKERTMFSVFLASANLSDVQREIAEKRFNAGGTFADFTSHVKENKLFKRFLLDLSSFVIYSNHEAHDEERNHLKKLTDFLGLSSSQLEESLALTEQFIISNYEKIPFLQDNSSVEKVYGSLSKRWVKILGRNKDKLAAELKQSKELVSLIRKSTTTDLTPEEKETVKEQFKDLVKSMPSLAIFLLPGGALLLPLVLKVIPDLMPSAFRDNEVEK